MRMTKNSAAVIAACVAFNIHAGDASGGKVKEEAIIYQSLDSHQPDDIKRAIDQIRKSKRPAGVRALANRIHNGLPRDLLLSAIDALVEIKGNLAAKTLLELSDHRSYVVRKKIAMSLPLVRGGAATGKLVEMLDDENADVRSQAAVAIGELDPQKAMDSLIAAAELGVLEASEVAGEHIRPAKIPGLIKALDDENIPALTPLFKALATRKDVPKKLKLAVVDRLKEISTARSKRLLIVLATSLPEWNEVKLAAAEILIKEMDKKETEKDEAKKDDAPKEEAKKEEPAEQKEKPETKGAGKGETK